MILSIFANNLFKQNKSYAKQYETYADIIQEINRIPSIQEAKLIQYSNRMAVRLVTALLDKGATVDLYVKNPNTHFVSELQQQRIENTIRALPDELSRTLGVLRVYTYDPPASLRGVMIDDRLLGIGWYTQRVR